MTKILLFHAPWCVPCHMMMEQFKDMPGLQTVDCGDDDNAPLARHYNVRCFPTVVVTKDGEPVWHHGGLVTREKVEKVVRGDLD